METPELKTEELSVPAPAVESRPVKPQRQETVWDTLRSLLIVLAGVLCIRTFVAEATVIPTGSMESTILIGDHVFLNKLLYGPRLPYTSLRMPPLRDIHRQEIVAFRYPRNPSVMFVKRVIGAKRQVAVLGSGGGISEDAAGIVIDVGGDEPRPDDGEEDGDMIAEPAQEFPHPSLLPQH